MTRSIAFGVRLLLAFALGLTCARARADASESSPTSVYMLTIWTEDADDQADALTRAMRVQARDARGWELLETSQSFETLAIALKCPTKPDAACLQRIGDQLKTDHYVWGTMEKSKGVPGEVSVRLHLWARGRPGVEASEDLPDTLTDANDESLRAIASRLFGRLTGTGSASAAASAPAVAPVPTVARPTISPAVAPEPPPQAPPPIAERASPAESASAHPFPSRILVTYAALAVGAGLLVASAVEAADWVGDRDASTNDRALVPRSVTDVCMVDPQSAWAAAAQDACSKGKDAVNASSLAWIFGGIGAAMAGAGVWLLASHQEARGNGGGETSRGAAAPRVVLLPSLSPRAGSVDVYVTF